MIQRLETADSPVFDDYAAAYEAQLQQGLRLCGESPDYFARRRIEWTAQLLQSEAIDRVLDYGCGIGLAAPRLRERFPRAELWGFDPSRAEIERAEHEQRRATVSFTADESDLPVGKFDLAYCNGVFHHIEPSQRSAALSTVRRALRTGGWFALWENNPWNPGTRMVMRRVPFDRDAIPLSPIVARRLLRDAGFRCVRTDSWFLFPRVLRWLRPIERLISRLPLGGQYLVLAKAE